MLSIVSTPIGNLKDITLRAIETLKSAHLILAEDTRKSRILLNALDIHTKMISFHQHNEKAREDEVISRLKESEQIALISDAGTPGISDPGNRLIQRCRKEGIKMEVIPGPCAFVAALSLFGLDPPYQFVGFLDNMKEKEWVELLFYQGHSICYESPHHLMKTLECFLKRAPHKTLYLARELTKQYEETLEGLPEELLAHFQKGKILGEFVMIIPGFENPFEKDPEALIKELQEVFGVAPKEALVAAAKLLNRPKKELYDLVHRS